MEKRIFLFRKYQRITWTELYKVFLSFSYPSPDLKIMVTYIFSYIKKYMFQFVLISESDLIYALDSRIYDRHAKEFLKRERRKL